MDQRNSVTLSPKRQELNIQLFNTTIFNKKGPSFGGTIKSTHHHINITQSTHNHSSHFNQHTTSGNHQRTIKSLSFHIFKSLIDTD
jgi:hypothetical protein